MKQKNSSITIWLLVLSIFIDTMGFSIVIPLLPYFAENLGASEIQYGAVIAVFSFAQFVAAPIWGTISDKKGRRPTILIGIGGTSFGFFVFAYSTTLNLLFLSRILTGIFTASTLTTANAYIADISTEKLRARSYGLLSAAFGIGFAIGPVIGGSLAQIHVNGKPLYFVPGLFAMGVSIINMLGAFFYLPEPVVKRIQSNQIGTIDSLKIILSNRKSLLYISLFALNNLSFSNFISAFALYIPKRFPESNEQVLGMIYSIFGLGLALTQMLVYRPLAKKFPSDLFIFTGASLAFLAFALLPSANSILFVLIFLSPLIIAIAFLNPSLLNKISLELNDELQGSGMGLNQGISSLMRILGPLMGGFLISLSLNLPFVLSAILSASIAMIVLLIQKLPNSGKKKETLL